MPGAQQVLNTYLLNGQVDIPLTKLLAFPVPNPYSLLLQSPSVSPKANLVENTLGHFPGIHRTGGGSSDAPAGTALPTLTALSPATDLGSSIALAGLPGSS